MFEKKPPRDHEIPPGRDKESFKLGYSGQGFDPAGAKDSYLGHRAGQEKRQEEELAWLRKHEEDRSPERQDLQSQAQILSNQARVEAERILLEKQARYQQTAGARLMTCKQERSRALRCSGPCHIAEKRLRSGERPCRSGWCLAQGPLRALEDAPHDQRPRTLGTDWNRAPARLRTTNKATQAPR